MNKFGLQLYKFILLKHVQKKLGRLTYSKKQ